MRRLLIVRLLCSGYLSQWAHMAVPTLAAYLGAYKQCTMHRRRVQPQVRDTKLLEKDLLEAHQDGRCRQQAGLQAGAKCLQQSHFPSPCAGTPPAELWPVSLLFKTIMQSAFLGHERVLMQVQVSRASGRLTSPGACPGAWWKCRAPLGGSHPTALAHFDGLKASATSPLLPAD